MHAGSNSLLCCSSPTEAAPPFPRPLAGEWEDDGWLQSSADPAHCRVAGLGVTRAVAGQTGELLIEVGGHGRMAGVCSALGQPP